MNIQYEIIECNQKNEELIQYLIKYAEVDADDYDKYFHGDMNVQMANVFM